MSDADFAARRAAARAEIDALEGAMGGDPDARNAWFHEVYRRAGDDPAGVPWADLAPKPQLTEWLAHNPGEGRRALDIACGLGDNAEAIAAAGYRTVAFDIVGEAIGWARRRFPDSAVDYRLADLYAAPDDWRSGFDLVHECYTVQALDGDLRARFFGTVAQFVAPGGRLLVITRTRPDEATADGPPWPLGPAELAAFATGGLVLEDRLDYVPPRADGRTVPHARLVLRRS